MTDRLIPRFPSQGSSWKPGCVVSRPVTRESGKSGNSHNRPETRFLPRESHDLQLGTAPGLVYSWKPPRGERDEKPKCNADFKVMLQQPAPAE